MGRNHSILERDYTAMKLDLTLPEINAVLQALGGMPYAQVFELVQKIRTQAQAQVAPEPENENG